jgi:hypothetical protein
MQQFSSVPGIVAALLLYAAPPQFHVAAALLTLRCWQVRCRVMKKAKSASVQDHALIYEVLH